MNEKQSFYEVFSSLNLMHFYKWFYSTAPSKMWYNIQRRLTIFERHNIQRRLLANNRL